MLYNDTKEVLNWFGNYLMFSFKILHETCFASWQKSHIQLSLKFTLSTRD